MRHAALSLAITVTLVVGSAHRSPAADACLLLTKDIAAAALGEAVGEPKRAGNAQVYGCGYQSSEIHSIHLTVRQMTPDMVAAYKPLCDKKTKDGLSGLGPTACWYDDKHGELQVLKGTTFFAIQLRRSGDPTEPIKAAARKVFDQLK